MNIMVVVDVSSISFSRISDTVFYVGLLCVRQPDNLDKLPLKIALNTRKTPPFLPLS